MRRLVPIFVLLAACGGTATVSVDSTDAPVVTDTPVVTEAPGATTPGDTQSQSTTPPVSEGPTTTASDRQVAPDFTLELYDGGSYTLSESGNPVYLVFWAEW